MTLTPVKSQDPKVGYYVAGVEDSGNLIIQPFPKTGCCDGSSTTMTIPHVAGVPVNAPADGDPNIIYDNVNNHLYMWDNNPPPAKWVLISGGSSSGGTGGGTGGAGGGAVVPVAPSIPIVSGKPTAPPSTGAGNVVWDETNGQLWVWNGSAWVTHQDALTPNAPPPIGIGAALPATGKEGEVFFSTASNQLYIWTNGGWVQAQAVAAANAPDAVRFVAALPPLPDPAYPAGTTVLNKADDKLWENIAGTWTVVPLHADIAARSITAGQIAVGAIGASEANIASLWAGMFAANQIQAGQIAAGAITGTEIRGGSITADKFAANAITVGTAQIADASITTLKVAGEAINVIRQVNHQATIEIGPSKQIVALSMYLPEAAKVLINCSMNLLTHGRPAIELVGTTTDAIGCFKSYGGFYVTIDGVDQIGWFLRDTMAVSCERDLTAGNHTFAVVLTPNTPSGINVQVGNVSLVVHGAMR